MDEVDIELDAVGLVCPIPLLKAKQSLKRMQAGQVLRVTATDAGSWRDFAVYIQHSAHRLLERRQQGDRYIYLIEKG